MQPLEGTVGDVPQNVRTRLLFDVVVLLGCITDP